jgi:hypothetical protein
VPLATRQHQPAVDGGIRTHGRFWENCQQKRSISKLKKQQYYGAVQKLSSGLARLTFSLLPFGRSLVQKHNIFNINERQF